MVLVSIITINYNNKEGLEATIKSVVSQSSSNFEYIVVDGGSTDGSFTLLEEYNNLITYWVSEKDQGIYNAMNKGIRFSKGEYLLFLNSGDYFVNNFVLEKAVNVFCLDCNFIVGNMIVDDGQKKRLHTNPDKITSDYLIYGSISHPSTFIRRALFEKYGYYNENFKIVSDWEFFILTLIMKNESYQKIPITISIFNTFGISQSPNHKSLHDEERRAVIAQFFPKRILDDIEKYHTYKKNISEEQLIILHGILRKKILRRFLKASLIILNLFVKRNQND